jgi:ribonucrease Y
MEIIIGIIIGALIGGGTAFSLLKQKENQGLIEAEKRLLSVKQEIVASESEMKSKQMEAKDASMKAKDEAREIVSEAKTQAHEMKVELEKEKTRVEGREQQVETKDKDLDKKFAQIEEMKKGLEDKDKTLDEERKRIEKALEEQDKKLEEISKMPKTEAKELLLNRVEDQTKTVLLKQMEKAEADVKEDAQKKAQKIICQAIQRYASEVASENMTMMVDLPNDEMKGRIIGREGRNINALERVTGIDIVVDDTPNAIMVSGFDMARRYVAKRLIEKLIEDGRVHPARIEELAEKVRGDTNNLIKEMGEKTLIEMGISGIHPDLVKILGRLRFRTSYGQNQLKHAQEVAYICMSMASELGIDPEKAKIAGLFHDIGKAIDHEIEGGHAVIGYEILKKYGVDEEIAYAVGSHHEDMPINSSLGFIVCAGDAISGARPGARRENSDSYVKRLKGLEAIAKSFDGVEIAYAVQAGRELRIQVNPSKIDDYGAKKLSIDIAGKVEKDMTYPGQVKVHVIRETREIEFAK